MADRQNYRLDVRRTVDGISVIVPAHNEGSYIRASLGSIATAASRTAVPVETIVVANRCTDGTAGIARSLGAAVVESDARNIAAVRNAGAAAGTRSILVTMDADCQMTQTR